MNQPLGEYPDVPVRSGVRAVLDAAVVVGESARKLAAVAELHVRGAGCQDADCNCSDECTECGQIWPCDTMRVIESVSR